jgi:NhaA family Na+:H+ antiporter
MLAILILMNRGRIYQKLPYGVFGILMWWFVLQSGVHATIAGVLLALTIPTRPAPNTKALVAQCSNLMSGYSLPERADEEVRHAAVQTLESITQRIQSPLESLEHDIQPWTTYLILPIFALANAGIVLSGVSVDSLTSTITLGIIFGLVLGKPLGIVGFSWIAIRMGWAELPSRVSWKSFISVSFLAGIGFTMSLFISNLAFADPQVIDEAKIGILIASALATIIGLGLGFAFNEPIGSRKSS